MPSSSAGNLDAAAASAIAAPIVLHMLQPNVEDGAELRNCSGKYDGAAARMLLHNGQVPHSGEGSHGREIGGFSAMRNCANSSRLKQGPVSLS